MESLKCKMCGGDLEIIPGSSVAECMFCGSQQTIMTTEDEDLRNLFNRANILRMKSEFDKAADIYEKILQKSETEAEAYWGLVLCKYGIEYIEDPASYKRVPTCHRASYDAVAADEDYKKALLYADPFQQKIYVEEAAAIDEIQKGILTLARQEVPYDIFICYKETDALGKRTQDSVIANDIYHQLTQEGYKVFYAAITLEDKLGKEYEPYIFSALNTAKVMLVIGTKPEYFNAVWVKNEWSRFLKIMKVDRSKLLIPCYRDMDAYELPDEFAHLQAQDMSKIGFVNDLVRGIKKVISNDSAKNVTAKVRETAVVYSSNVEALLKRGQIALEDKEWDRADKFFEEVLNQNAECAEAYLGKYLASKKVDNLKELAESLLKSSENVRELKEEYPEYKNHVEEIIRINAIENYLPEATIRSMYKFDRKYGSSLKMRRDQQTAIKKSFTTNTLLNRAYSFADPELKKQIQTAMTYIMHVAEERVKEEEIKVNDSIARIKKAYEEHLEITDKKVEKLRETAAKQREEDYGQLLDRFEKADSEAEYAEVKKKMQQFHDYKESTDYIIKCDEAINRLKEEEQQLLKKKKRRKIRILKTVFALGLLIAVLYVSYEPVCYWYGVKLYEKGEYDKAIKVIPYFHSSGEKYRLLCEYHIDYDKAKESLLELTEPTFELYGLDDVQISQITEPKKYSYSTLVSCCFESQKFSDLPDDIKYECLGEIHEVISDRQYVFSKDSYYYTWDIATTDMISQEVNYYRSSDGLVADGNTIYKVYKSHSSSSSKNKCKSCGKTGSLSGGGYCDDCARKKMYRDLDDEDMNYGY